MEFCRPVENLWNAVTALTGPSPAARRGRKRGVYTAPRMALLTRLDRMVMREVVTPATLGFVVYTFLLAMRAIFGLVEQIFVRGVSFHDAAQLLVCSLPHVVVLTIPMGFLFGVLIAMGRMNNDNEIIALQAGGVSARRLLRPVMLLAVLIGAVNAYVTVTVMPEANRTLRALRVEVFTSARSLGRIEPRVFHEGFADLLLYIDDVTDSGEWENVVLYDRSEPGVERLTLARTGRLLTGESLNADSDEPWLELEDSVTHQFLASKPATHRVNHNQTQLHRLRFPDQSQTRYRPGLREASTWDLVHQARSRGPLLDEEQEKEHRLAGVELHKRLAIPCACLAFGLLALPLGIGTRSGGRGRGFLLSILVILVYYVMFNHGELLASEGRIPVWLGIWFPNLLLSAGAILLMRGVGRWLGERQHGGGLLSSLVRRWRDHSSVWRSARGAVEARQGREGVGAGTPLKRRVMGGFPTLLDRYLTRRLLLPLALVLVSTSGLYIVVDLTDRVDEIARSKVGFGIVAAYYWNLVPQVVLDVMPFGLMIAVLIVLTVLERQLELTALKAGGVSIFRVMLPILILASAASVGLWILQESIVPAANRDAKRLLDRIKGRETTRSYRTTDRQWLLSRDGSTLYSFLRYEVESKTMIRLTLFRIDRSMELRYHLFADRVRYVDGSWVADSGWSREFRPDGSDEFRQILSPRRIDDVPEGPEYFGQEYRLPAEMSYRQLRKYIDEVVASGYRPHKLIVRWQQKLSYPLSAFVMVFLALPYGLNRGGRRVTTMQGIALALGLGMGYFLVVAVFGKMGEADLLPPMVAAWSPVVLGGMFAVNRMTTLRT